MTKRVVLAPQEGPQTQFVNLWAGVAGEPEQVHDFPLVFYGGAAGGGKSFSLLFDVLKYIDCPDFYGVFFRKTVKQLERTLWKEAKKMYRPFLYDDNGKLKGRARVKEKDKVIVFPTGATVEFSYLDADNTTETNWQGAELTAAYFD